MLLSTKQSLRSEKWQCQISHFKMVTRIKWSIDCLYRANSSDESVKLLCLRRTVTALAPFTKVSHYQVVLCGLGGLCSDIKEALWQ